MKQLGALLHPPGWKASPSQGTQHEAIKSITDPPGWDAGPSQGNQHEATRSINTPTGWDAGPSQGTSMKQLGVLILPLDGMLVHHRVPA